MEKRFSEEQHHRHLEGSRGWLKAAELCRKHGIWEAAHYNWKAKFGGMTVSEAQRRASPGMDYRWHFSPIT